MCLCMCEYFQRPDEGVGSLELEPQAVVRCTMWVLESDLGFSEEHQVRLNTKPSLRTPASHI